MAQLGTAGIEPTQLALGISQAVAYSHTRRLVDAGYMWRTSTNDGGGGVVAVTRRGASVARDRGVAAVTPRSQAPSTAVHGRAVSWIAAWAEVRGRTWIGPATIAADNRWALSREDGARHRPDLVFDADSRFVAVEVELHSKGPQRLQTILKAYRRKLGSGDLWNVAYVVDKPPVGRLVERQVDRTRLQRSVGVTMLDEIIRITREHAS